MSDMNNKDFSTELLESDPRLFRTSDNFLLREVAGEYLLVPVGEGAELMNGMITVNDSFQYLWKQFEEPKTIGQVLKDTREVYEDEDGSIAEDIIRFVQESLKYGFMKEDE